MTTRVHCCVLIAFVLACRGSMPEAPSRPWSTVGNGSTAAVPAHRAEHFPIERLGHAITEASIFDQRLQACRKGDEISCHRAATGAREGSPIVELERALCAAGRVYACRVLAYERLRPIDPLDCVLGIDPYECEAVLQPWDRYAEVRGRMLRAGCLHGVIFDCVMIEGGLVDSVPLEELRNAMTTVCYQSKHGVRGACAGIARLELHLGRPMHARHFLEFGCQIYDDCTPLAAAYRDGHVPELRPGRASDILESSCPHAIGHLDDECLYITYFSEYLRERPSGLRPRTP